MATVTAPNRSIVAVLFIVGGALQILGAVLGIANVGNAGGFYLLSNLVLGVGFVLLLVWFASTTVTRAGYFIAALGWLLLAVAGLVNLPFLSEAATLIAIVGTVFAGVIVIMGRPFGGKASIYADTIFFVAIVARASRGPVTSMSKRKALLSPSSWPLKVFSIERVSPSRKTTSPESFASIVYAPPLRAISVTATPAEKRSPGRANCGRIG